MTQLPKQIDDDTLRKQAWDFMQMQAGQRLQTFNFYVVISVALTAGLVTSLKPTEVNALGASVAGVMLTFLCFVFYRLDLRNRELIRSAEDTLKLFEKSSALPDDGEVPHPAKRFMREQYETDRQRMVRSPLFWKNHFSYTDCFRCVFWTFAIVGILGVAAVFLL